jgi:hypothetical protein
VKDTAKIMIISLFANLALQNNVIFMFFIITNRHKSRIGHHAPHGRIFPLGPHLFEFLMQEGGQLCLQLVI